MISRFQKPSPKFFVRLMKIGVAIGAVGGALIAAPVGLPVAVITIGGYLVVAGSITVAISGLTTTDDK